MKIPPLSDWNPDFLPPYINYLSFPPSFISLCLSLLHPPPKLCSFWMSRFYELSDKAKGNEGQREKERWRTDRDGDKKKNKLKREMRHRQNSKQC